MNVQFAVPRDGRGIFILEVNPRASRTVPFVSKVTGVALAKVAARIAVGRTLKEMGIREVTPKHIAVKEAVFPFAKFAGVDTLLGPEMRSTGEVMGIDTSFAAAFGKSQIGAGTRLPMRGTAFISVQDSDKANAVAVAKGLVDLGFEVLATRGTHAFLKAQGIAVERINKVREGRPHCVDRILDGGIHLVINTTAGAEAIKDSFPIRRNALLKGIPYYTTMSAARAAVGAIAELRAGKMRVRSLQEYQAEEIGRRFVAMAKFPMTPRGQQVLREELKRLREVERPKNVLDIEEARAHGDLKENAEYHAAKERQGFIEGRSRDIESILAQAEVIDPTKLSGSKVVFGATVKLTDTDSGEVVTYMVVGDHEADIKAGRIAVSAPLARAMIGREKGESVTLKTGKGTREYEISDVRFVTPS